MEEFGEAGLGKGSAKPVLSRRQFECLQGVADLLDSVQIASRLGISEHTVNGHLAAAVAALEATSRRDAVRKYLAIQASHPEKLTGQFLRVSAEPFPRPAEPVVSAVREPVAPTWGNPSPPRQAFGGEANDVGNRLKIIATIVGLALAIIVIVLAIDPLTQSAMRMANSIQPFHHIR